MVIDLAENEDRSKIEVINCETRTLVFDECQGDWQDHREGGAEDGAHGRRFTGTLLVWIDR